MFGCRSCGAVKPTWSFTHHGHQGGKEKEEGEEMNTTILPSLWHPSLYNDEYYITQGFP